jgi:glycerate kinase
VTGPAGIPVTAAWRREHDRAVIEAAQANGLLLAGGPERNDPLAATSAGVGELILAAAEDGARRVVVGVGGSATTDGGAPCVEVLARLRPLDGSGAGPRVEVCCDVRTHFVDAARDFGPQKGADADQVQLLTERLRALARRYRDEYGVDVTAVPGSGAAGGLGGGLAALGAVLLPGFDTIAAHLDLDARIAASDLVVTGEGSFDRTSLDGKVVGGLREHAARYGVPVLVVAGTVADELAGELAGGDVVSLVDTFGLQRSRERTAECVTEVVEQYLRRR